MADQATLVIVEDDSLFAEALMALVESLGYRVLATATSEPNAIKAVLDFQPDAVLMDIKLESGNGLSAARLIREKSQVPIVFCTSYSSDADTQRAVQQLGNASLIDKLIDEAKLVGLLDNVLRTSAPTLPLSASEPWPPTMVDRINAYADAAGVTRSEALRHLVELGLNAKPKKPVQAKRRKSAQVREIGRRRQLRTYKVRAIPLRKLKSGTLYYGVDCLVCGEVVHLFTQPRNGVPGTKIASLGHLLTECQHCGASRMYQPTALKLRPWRT